MIICSHLGLGPPDGAGLDGAGLVEPGEDLGHAAVGDEELPRDVARAHLRLGVRYCVHGDCWSISINPSLPNDMSEFRESEPIGICTNINSIDD